MISAFGVEHPDRVAKADGQPSDNYKALVWNRDLLGHPGAKRDRQIMRRAQIKGQLVGGGGGAAAGAALGGLASGNSEGAKVGALLGGLTGQLSGDYVGRKRGMKHPDYTQKAPGASVAKSAFGVQHQQVATPALPQAVLQDFPGRVPLSRGAAAKLVVNRAADSPTLQQAGGQLKQKMIKSAFGVEHADTDVAKADTTKADTGQRNLVTTDASRRQTGRETLAGTLPGVHAAVAGKQGHKLRAAGRELGYAGAGGLAVQGAVMTATKGKYRAGAVPVLAGNMVGGHYAVAANDKRGHYQPLAKSLSGAARRVVGIPATRSLPKTAKEFAGGVRTSHREVRPASWALKQRNVQHQSLLRQPGSTLPDTHERTVTGGGLTGRGRLALVAVPTAGVTGVRANKRKREGGGFDG